MPDWTKGADGNWHHAAISNGRHYQDGRPVDEPRGGLVLDHVLTAHEITALTTAHESGDWSDPIVVALIEESRRVGEVMRNSRQRAG